MIANLYHKFESIIILFLVQRHEYAEISGGEVRGDDKDTKGTEEQNQISYCQ